MKLYEKHLIDGQKIVFDKLTDYYNLEIGQGYEDWYSEIGFKDEMLHTIDDLIMHLKKIKEILEAEKDRNDTT